MRRRKLLAALAVAPALAARAQSASAVIDVVADGGADPSGKTSSVAGFQRAMARAARAVTSRVRVPAGRYRFDVGGDADTIRIPSGCTLECAPGVRFEWDHWGSPLFAIINVRRVRLACNGATFVWSGRFARTAGARNAFDYGTAIPAYEWCCHIIAMGSDEVSIEGAHCAGASTANTLNAFVQVGGKADGGATFGNTVRDLVANDVCQVLLFSCQRRFTVRNLRVGRYANASAQLYGPGHVIYATQGATPSEEVDIQDIYDAGVPIDPFSLGAATVSLKNVLKGSVRGLYSQRAEGVLSLRDCEDLDVELEYRSAATDPDTWVGVIYFIDPTRVNRRVRIKGSLTLEKQRNCILVNMAGTASSDKNRECELDLTLNVDGGESTIAIAWVGVDGQARIDYRARSPDKTPVLLHLDRGAQRNRFDLKAAGSQPPRVALGERGDNRDNQIGCQPGSRLGFDARHFGAGRANRLDCGA